MARDKDLGPLAVVLPFVLAVPFGVIGFLLAELLALPKWSKVPFAAALGIGAGFFVRIVSAQIIGGTARFIARFLAPSGSTTPYQPDFSYQKALAIRGDVEGAIESFEALLVAHPNDIEAFVEAAELNARSGRHQRAAELFLGARQIPGISRTRDIYASQRLVDLYLGPLANDGRALVELRRMSERFAGTDAATRAREAIARLKRS